MGNGEKMIGNNESEIPISENEATKTELTQIGNVNESPIKIAIDGDDNQTVDIPEIGEETPKESQIINDNLCFDKGFYGIYCDMCGGTTWIKMVEIPDGPCDKHFDLPDDIGECAHCGDTDLFNEYDDFDFEETKIDPKPEGILSIEINGYHYKQIVDILNVLTEEVKLNISPKTINAKIVDPSHVAMINLEIDRNAFLSFMANDFTLGIDCTKLKELARGIKKDTIISLDLGGRGNDKLIYKIGINSGEIGTVDITGMSDTKVPNVNLPTDFQIPIKEFYEILKRAEDLTDHVEIIIDNESLIIQAMGETDIAKAKFDKNNGLSIWGFGGNDSKYRSLFSLSYLMDIVKALKGIKELKYIRMRMGTDYPLMIYSEDILNGYGKIEYLVAPRIEND